MQLYRSGLTAENNGHFDEAAVIYENALFKLKKVRFHQMLKKRLVEKIALLKQIKTYKKEQNFIRENNS